VRPELAHGRGLATIYPAYFRWLLARGRATERFAQLGRRLFGLAGDTANCAAGFISAFEHWLAANGLRQSAASLGFSAADFIRVADYAVKTYGDGRSIDALGPITRDEIIQILADTARQDHALQA
jgi:alcohol dehydrogenase YqhD (iron-dependent ADH family)